MLNFAQTSQRDMAKKKNVDQDFENLRRQMPEDVKRSMDAEGIRSMEDLFLSFVKKGIDPMKLMTPRINGICVSALLLANDSYSSTATSISPSGVRMATEYLSLFFIMIPSRTAWPPIPE